MTNQQGAPEALRPITRYEVVDCIDSKHVPAVIPNRAGPWVRYEDHVAALVEAQQPAAHVQNPAAIEHVAGDVSKNDAESNMAYAELPEQVGWRDSTYHCDLYYDPPYRDGLAPLFTADQMRAFADATHAIRTQRPSPTPQADSQPAPDQRQQLDAYYSLLDAMGWESKRQHISPETWAADLLRDATAYRAARAPADSVTAPAVPEGWKLVPSKKLLHAYAQAKLAADQIVGFAGAKPESMCGWLDDACTAADIAAKDLEQMLAAPTAPTQAQAGAVPLTADEREALWESHGPTRVKWGHWEWHQQGIEDAERHHGIKGGQHG